MHAMSDIRIAIGARLRSGMGLGHGCPSLTSGTLFPRTVEVRGHGAKALHGRASLEDARSLRCQAFRFWR